MDLFEVIDLTHPSELILVADNARATIGKIPYTIQDGFINSALEYSLQVSGLTKDILTLIVKIDFQHGDVSLKGEIKEMTFVAMRY